MISEKQAWICILGLFFLVFFTPSAWTLEPSAAPLASNPRIADFTIGFNGYYKLGFWTPATVTIEGGSDPVDYQVEVDAPDSDGAIVTYPSVAPLPESAGTRQRRKVFFLIRVGRVDATFGVRLVRDGKSLVEKAFFTGASEVAGVRQGLAGTSRLFLSIGPPVGLAEALDNPALDPSVATYVVPIRNQTGLPRDSLAYDGIDGIILAIGQVNSAAAKLTTDQRDALLEWMVQGGRVVLVAGPDCEALLASGGLLAPFVPGKFAQMESLLQGTAIEAFCDSKYAIRVSSGQMELKVPRITEVRGKVLIYEGNRPSDLPLLVREPCGLGEVTWIAFDLAAPPLSDWAGRSHLLARLFTRLPEDIYQSIAATSGGLTSLGYNDLTGQLRVSLDEFPGVHIVPFALVTLLAVLYIALIGPLDYLIVRRWLARPALTWITLPVWIVLFSLLAWWIGWKYKSDQVRANHAELVDIDGTTGQVRGTVWVHLFSPQITTFNLSLAPSLPDGSQPRNPESVVAWLGLPGNALGGMQATGDDSPFARGYRIDPIRGILEELPLSVSSTKSLACRWFARTNRSLRSDLVDGGDGLLDGSIENTSGCNLSNVRLLYGHRAWTLGDLASGGTIDLDSVRDPLSIRTVLTSKASGIPIPGDSETSDPASTQMDAILDRMMWYQQMGGPSYVRLFHRYQAFCDMSWQLDLGRAVLTGVPDRSGSRLLESGQPLGTPDDKHLVVCRFVLPVRAEK
ncbi:MAG: hypothetical protein JW829_03840 [Pirellulales bacterium]|nr:hypothetical protein [Pirellulales bacterium]